RKEVFLSERTTPEPRTTAKTESAHAALENWGNQTCSSKLYFFAAFRAANFFALAPLVAFGVLLVAFFAAFFVFVLFVPFVLFCGFSSGGVPGISLPSPFGSFRASDC